MVKMDQNEEKKTLPERESLSDHSLFRSLFHGVKDNKLLFKLVLIILCGVFLMTLGNWSGNRSSNPDQTVTATDTEGYYSNEKALEERLEGILSQISGAGQVKVAVSFASGKEVEYAYNSDTSKKVTTEEGTTDTGAGSDVEDSKSLTLATENDNPVVVRESMPEILGVLVVASGAKDPGVKNKIFEAVEGLLALPAHRIVISN